MSTKTNCKAPKRGSSVQHNETLVCDSSKSLKVKTALRAGKKAPK
jgi:hypothetical protein